MRHEWNQKAAFKQHICSCYCCNFRFIRTTPRCNSSFSSGVIILLFGFPVVAAVSGNLVRWSFIAFFLFAVIHFHCTFSLYFEALLLYSFLCLARFGLLHLLQQFNSSGVAYCFDCSCCCNTCTNILYEHVVQRETFFKK